MLESWNIIHWKGGMHSFVWSKKCRKVEQAACKDPKKGHTRGGRTHNVTQRTDTHIFTGGGGRTHNVTQRTDTQKRTN